MAYRYEDVFELMRSTADSIVKDSDSWKQFLNTAAMNYKRPFHNQLLIFNQKPDATACATFDYWNQKMGRFVKKGSKGIVTIDLTSQKKEILFDISDTGSNNKSVVPVWAVTDEMYVPLGYALQEHFGTAVNSGDLAAVLFETGLMAAEEALPALIDSIQVHIKDSGLASFDDKGLENALRETLSNSLIYELLKRCALNPDDYSESLDFSYIHCFNSNDTIAALGSAINVTANGLFKDISLAVRSIENVLTLKENRFEEAEHNDNDIQQTGGLSDSERVHSETEDGLREVRNDAENLLDEREGRGIYVTANEGSLESTPERDRRDGDGERERIGSADGIDGGRDGGFEGDQPDEVGGPYEQFPPVSSGDNSRGDDLRIEDEVSEALEAADDKHPNLSFEFVLTNVLQNHRHMHVTGPEIQNFFLENTGEGERVEFLKEAYNKDYTELLTPGDEYRLGYHADTDGLEVWIGSYLGAKSRVVVPWEVVVKAIDFLIDRDQLLSVSERVELPSEEQQAFSAVESENHKALPEILGLELPQQIIDEVICSGSNNRDSVFNICAFYKRNHTTDEGTRFLAEEYGSGTGKGFVIDGVAYSVLFEEDGIRIAEGKSVVSAEDTALLSWNYVDRRIKELLTLGRYMSAADYAAVEEKLLDKSAENIWSVHRDILSKDICDKFSLSAYAGLPLDFALHNFTEDVEAIKNELNKPDVVSALLDETRTLIEACKGREPELRLSRYKFNYLGEVLASLDNLNRDVVPYPVTGAFEPSYKAFITDDEVDLDLIGGTGTQNGKYRIYLYFNEPHSLSEKASFLKNEYGIGGGNGALGGLLNADHSHDSKGIVLSKGSISKPYDSVTLSWNVVARKIDDLIKSGRYLTDNEVENLPAYEKDFIANAIYNFFVDVPVEFERPFSFGSSRTEAVGDIIVLLDDISEAQNILSSMQAYMASLEDDARNYQFKELCLKYVERFASGVSLFDFEARKSEWELPGEETPPEEAKNRDENGDVSYRYDIKPGDVVTLDGGRFVVVGMENGEVVLNDEAFPLFTQTYGLDEFNEKLGESSDNNIYRVAVTEGEEHDDKNVVDGRGEADAPVSEVSEALPSAETVYRYYFKLKSPEDGYPTPEGNEPLNVVVLDGRPYIEDFGIYSSGYVEYAKRLSVDDLNKYDLMLYEPPIVARETMHKYQLGFGALGNGTTVWNRLEREDGDYKIVAHISDEGVVTVYDKNMPQEALDKIQDVADKDRAAFEEKLRVAAEAFAEVEKRYATPKPEINRRTTVCKNYKLLNSFAGDVLSGKYDYMRFESEGYEPLYVERIGDNQIAMAHTFVQNGDLMYDPEMVFTFDNEKEELQALSYEMSGFGMYQRVLDDNGRANIGLQRELNSFLNTWLKNIVEQAQPLVRAVDRDGNEYNFVQDKEEELVFVGGEGAVPERGIVNVGDSFAIRDEEFKVKSIEGPGDDIDEVVLESVRDPGKFAVTTYGDIRKLLDDGLEQGPVAKKEEVLNDVLDVSKAAVESETLSQKRFGFDFDEYLRIKDLYPDDIVAYQVGDFYEFLGEDAEKVAKELDIVLTSRDVGLSERLAMCGVPSHAFNGFMDILIQNGYNVAVHGFNEQAGRVITVDYETQMAPQGSANDILNDNNISDGDKLVFEPDRLEQPERGMRAGHTTDARGEGTDYRIEHLAHDAKPPKERFRDNVAAISLLKQLEGENRLATAEEQKVLANYVGWGGLSDAFDESKSAWRSEHNQLLELLTPEEYSSAKASTLTAFYTSPEIIQFMYSTLENMGFKKGNILEPSCGVGNFIGMLPESLSESKVYGVEIDSISGRIAQQLYQKQDIRVQGFEKTDFPDSFFDVAIGNVPFGDFGVNDKKYNKNKFLIHDYFFAKALDKVRPGGIVAFITSKGTLDKESTAVREYIAQRAEFLGAVRLPDNAFKANAGTEVTSDIIFLQKREKPIEVDMSEESWIHCSDFNPATGELLEAPNGEYMSINSFFALHPENILGDIKIESTQYGYDTACKAREGEALSDLFKDIHIKVDKELFERSVEEQESSLDFLPADPSVRNFSYTLVDGEVYFRENSRMFPISFPNEETENRVKGLINLRDTVRLLIEMQTEDYSDSAIIKQRERLNAVYDAFAKKYGLVNDRKNKKAFESDNSYYLLASLENLDDEGKLKSKADIFYKRTIKPHVAVTHVDTSVEALEVSISEKACVDMPYMVDLSGKSAEEIEKDLVGVIFRVPGRMTGDGSPVFVPADEYLSGNVREKLRVAKEFSKQDEVFASNVKALEMVQPKDLDASEISIRLGTTWVPTEYIDEFMYELLETPSWCRGSYGVQTKFAPITGEWFIENKTRADHTVSANTTYGTKRISAYKIIEDTLNLRDARVYDYVEDENGRKKAVLNRDETTIAQQKQELIKEAFAEWIWNDPDRREYLTSYYNEHFNNIRPREYDGSHLSFGGINPEIELRKHQINAIARIIYGGNTLLAHAVGAGKTFEMVAAAQESKRLGLCNKSLFVVPNHLIEQFAADYMKLYPNANVLCSTKKDFEPGNRKRFCSRIATGDYDAIIIGHSQFEKIPLSPEEQRATIQEQIDDIESGIRTLQHEKGERFSVKQLEKTKKNLEAKLERLTDESRKDDVITFEELGVDRLFVDEAHYYKNLFLYTKMRNVAGIGSREAQKSSDLYMKCRYLDKKTDGKGVIFATGTPISNSMTELYTMQRYLQYDMLCERGLQHFDSWASTFGETITAIELAPEGNGYRAKTRFARFYNLPELLATFKEVADVQTADMLHLPVPKANFHTVALQPSDIQKELVQGLAERAEAIRDKRVKPTQDNMLLVTNDGRKLALDQRLIDPMFGDFEDSKVNICVNNVFDVWEKTKDKKSTQLVFCDLSTPKSGEEFDVYNDIRNKLIAKGIPKNEIAFVHNAKTETQKKKLFEKMRNGTVRVLLGSTSKLGVGTNIQDKLITLHDIDCPWRPSDLEQRLGRIVRQGNGNDEVDIYRYVTQDTFDAYCWQLIENKQSFISQILTSKSPSRSAEDIDEAVLSYAEIKSLATGDPRIKEKMDLDVSVKRLKLLKQSYLRERYSLEDKVLKTFPTDISRYTDLVAKCKKDIALFEKNTSTDSEYFFPMTVNGTVYADKGEAGAALIDFCKAQKKLTDEVPCGEYRGFKMSLAYDSWESTFKLIMQNELRYSVPLGNDKFGNITRINHLLSSLPEKLSAFENKLSDTYTQLENAQKQLQKPFAHEQELKEKSSRLDQLNIELSLDKDNAIDIASSFDEKETVATSSSGKSRDDEYER